MVTDFNFCGDAEVGIVHLGILDILCAETVNHSIQERIDETNLYKPLFAAVHGENPLGVCFQVDLFEHFLAVPRLPCEADVLHAVNTVGSHYTGKVLVLSPNTLKEEYWSPENQLWLAESGFGCSQTARGRSILCTCLGDGEQTRWNRNDFVGVLKDEYLPDWAKESLKQYQRSELEEKQQMQMGGM